MEEDKSTAEDTTMEEDKSTAGDTTMEEDKSTAGDTTMEEDKSTAGDAVADKAPPMTGLIETLKTNGAKQDEKKRRLSLERINSKIMKRKVSQHLIPSYLILNPPMGQKKKRGVTFPTDVLVKEAVTKGVADELKRLLAEHGNELADTKEPNGLPLVSRAILEDQIGCLEVLLAAGANILARDAEDWNVFHMASSMDNLDVAKLIMETGGEHKGMTQSRNMDGERPIDMAESLKMARFLLHADLAEFRLGCHGMGEHISYTEEEEAKVLDDVKKDFETQSTMTLNTVLKENTCYSSLLHLAATKNYPRVADYVCMNSVPFLEERDENGWTPLHAAAYYNNVDMALFLVERGASIYAITPTYKKPSDLTEHGLILSITK